MLRSLYINMNLNMKHKNLRQLIIPTWIVCVNKSFDVLIEHGLVIEDQTIQSILPLNLINKDEFDAVIELTGHALLPGFINTHTHAAMSLMRGMADDLALVDWLNKHIWPTESQYINQQFVEDGTALAIAEMIRSGTTCMNDMYFYPDIAGKISQQLGFRASIGLIVIDFPTVWAKDADEYLHKGLATNDLFKELDLVTAAFAPHAPYSVADAPLEKIAMYSSELDLRVHIHLHETAFEVNEALKNTGKRPLERLDQLGLVNDNLIAVHMTDLNPDEISRFAEAGGHIAHCPESNLKLASGFCPISQLHKEGVNISIGTDGAASNNDLDLLSEARTGALLAKGIAKDAASINAETLIKMLTIQGAKALALDDQIGSIEVGKKADLIAIDLSDINTTPVYDPISQIAYAANSRQVSHVWINGVLKLKQGCFVDMDIASIKHKAYHWRNKIRPLQTDIN